MGINLINDNLVAANSRMILHLAVSAGASGGGNICPFDTTDQDVGGGFSHDGSGTVTCNFDGFVFCSAYINMTGGLSNGDLIIRKNGTNAKPGLNPFAIGITSGNVAGSIAVSNGDTLDIFYSGAKDNYQGGGFAGAGICQVDFFRIPDYSAGQPAGFGLATSSVAGLMQPFRGFRATKDGPNISVPGAETQLVMTVEKFDPGNDYNLGSGAFTAPVTGYYHFNCQFAVVAGIPADTRLLSKIKINGAVEILKDFSVGNAAAANSAIAHSAMLYLTAGDVVTWFADSNQSINIFASQVHTGWDGRLIQQE